MLLLLLLRLVGRHGDTRAAMMRYSAACELEQSSDNRRVRV